MLKLSTKTTYAIRALIHLAQFGDQSAVRAIDVSEKQHIPVQYLEQIFSKLKKAGIVKAIRGPHGGFLLAKNAQDLNLAHVVSALEGPFEPVMCSMPENRSDDCHKVGDCSSRAICNELDGAIIGTLSKYTIASMAHQRFHGPEPDSQKIVINQ